MLSAIKQRIWEKFMSFESSIIGSLYFIGQCLQCLSLPGKNHPIEYHWNSRLRWPMPAMPVFARQNPPSPSLQAVSHAISSLITEVESCGLQFYQHGNINAGPCLMLYKWRRLCQLWTTIVIHLHEVLAVLWSSHAGLIWPLQAANGRETSTKDLEGAKLWRQQNERHEVSSLHVLSTFQICPSSINLSHIHDIFWPSICNSALTLKNFLWTCGTLKSEVLVFWFMTLKLVVAIQTLHWRQPKPSCSIFCYIVCSNLLYGYPCFRFPSAGFFATHIIARWCLQAPKHQIIQYPSRRTTDQQRGLLEADTYSLKDKSLRLNLLALDNMWEPSQLSTKELSFTMF